MKAYELDQQSIWTGVTYDLAPGQGRPKNSTVLEPPEVPDGQMAQLRGRTWVLIDSVPLSDVQRRSHEAKPKVSEWREKALNDGMPYTMPDGSEETVQTRPIDQLNLIALNSKAKAIVEAGGTAPIMFRAASNATHRLTPAEMLDMTTAALAYIEGVYQKSWEAKDSLNKATALDDISSVLDNLKSSN